MFNNHFILVQEPRLKVIPEASFSAIKGVSHFCFGGQSYILSVGYSSQLSTWKLLGDDSMTLQGSSRVSVDIGDVNCLAVYLSSDDSTCFVAVCGMGIELFRHGC